MKYLKSTLSDLREVFESSIDVKDIAEPFASFDASSDASVVSKFMDNKDYDIIGVREDGQVLGYAIKNELMGEKLRENIKHFEEDEILDERTPLKEVFEKLKNRRCIFVLVLGQIGGIITRGDLQKVPVRMWLFGLVSLIEIQLLRIIKEYYFNDEWRSHINDKRLGKAEDMLDERRTDDIDIGLADCLQFKDKYSIIKKENKLRKELSLGISKSECDILFEKLRKLRDRLAHVQNINFLELADIVREAEQLLEKLEQFSIASKKDK